MRARGHCSADHTEKNEGHSFIRMHASVMQCQGLDPSRHQAHSFQHAILACYHGHCSERGWGGGLPCGTQDTVHHPVQSVAGLPKTRCITLFRAWLGNLPCGWYSGHGHEDQAINLPTINALIWCASLIHIGNHTSPFGN